MISTAELAKKEFTGLDLPEPYGNFLGPIPENASMSIWGPPGSGKSTFAIDLAMVLANLLGTGIYCSSEEGPGPSMQNKVKRMKAEHENILVSDYAGIDTLKAAIDLSNAHFVVVDSISKSGIKVAEFESFLDWCKARNVITMFILHTTKEGNYKGHTEFIHNPDIEIKVEEGLARTENKNRYQETPREMEVIFDKTGNSKSTRKSNSKRKNPPKTDKEKIDLSGVDVIAKYKLKDRDGYFVITQNPNWAADKKNQDRFKMYETTKSGAVLEDWGTHSSFDRAKLFAVNNGAIEAEELFIGGERLNPADTEILSGLEYIANPGPDLRQNKAVTPDDIYALITNNIINVIETQGELPWQKQYSSSIFGHGMATNFVSGKEYSGINWVLLNFFKWVKIDGKKELIEGKFNSPYYLTFNQIEDLGGKLKKGSVGQLAMYYTRLYRYQQAEPELDYSTYKRDEMIEFIEDHRSEISLLKTFSAEEITDQSYYPILKYYNIFNGDDIDGIDFGEEIDTSKLSDTDRIKAAEAIYENYPGAPKIVHEEQSPFYAPKKDIINMPEFGSYNEPQYYYSTLFHEAVHSTGSPKRLDRDSMKNYSKGDNRPFEELIAEMGASFLSGEAGILFKTLHQSAAYLQGWNGALVDEMEDDHKFFFRAAARAQDAVDYILDRDEQGVPAYLKNKKLTDTEPKPSPTGDKEGLTASEREVFNELLPFYQKKALSEQGLKTLKGSLAKIANQYKDIPEIYSQGQKGKDAIAYIHIFNADSDWYITELDKPATAFGFVVLNQDWPYAELGYVSLEELLGQKNYQPGKSPEVDLYWEPKTINEIIKSNDPRNKEPETDLDSNSEGKLVDIYFKTDNPVIGRYKIIEIKNLIPSHNKDCSQNSKHVISKAQPRDRSAEELCHQSQLMAQNMNPALVTVGNKAFDGAPVVLPDGQVIQGNGRSIALKIMYDEYKKQAAKYRNYLDTHAVKFGFTPEYIESFEQPGLVREVDVSEKEAIRLGNIVDTSQAKMNRLDQAKAYIRQLDTEKRQIIGRIINSSSGETLGEVLDDKGLLILDQLKDLDRTGLVKNSALTTDGKDFIRQLFAGLVFDSDINKNALKFFSRMLHNTKAGIERSYGYIIPFIGTERNIAPTLQKAIEIVQAVQNNDSLGTVGDYLAQGDAFAGINRDRFNKEEIELAEFLLAQTTQKAIKNAFQTYYYKSIGRNDLINPVEKVSPKRAFKDSFVDQVRINPNVRITATGLSKENKKHLEKLGVDISIQGPGYYLGVPEDKEDEVRKYLAAQERVRTNPPETIVKLYKPSHFEKGDIVRDYYDNAKYEYSSKRKGTYYLKNLKTGKTEKFSDKHKRFIPNRAVTPTLFLFRYNPKSPLIYIGKTEQLTVDTGNGIKALKGEFPTFLSEDKLYIVPKHRIEKVKNMVTAEEAVDGFEQWHNYQADENDYAIDWPEEKPKPAGSAHKIWYASDKIMQNGDAKGEINHYVHEFDAGKRPVSVKGDIVIIGNIEWNKRGILN